MRLSVAILACVLAISIPISAQVLDTNILQNGGAEDGTIDDAGLSGAAPSITLPDCTSVISATEGSANTGSYGLEWNPIGSWDIGNDGCANGTGPEYPGDLQWAVNASPYTGGVAESVTISMDVNVENMEAGKQVIVQFNGLDITDFNPQDFRNYVLTGGDAGWVTLTETIPMQDEFNIALVKIISWDATNWAVLGNSNPYDATNGLPEHVGIGGALFVDNLSFVFNEIGSGIIPETSGLSQTDATAALEAEGYVVEVGNDFSETVPEGEIIGTAPAAGSQLAPGSTVTLLISSGTPPEIPVMGLLGLGLACVGGIACAGVAIRKRSA